MKVVFTKDLSGVAKVNDIKEVNNGYAYNFLFPRGFAQAATADAVKKAEEAKANAIARKEELTANAQEIGKKLQDLELVFSEKVSEEGHLYGAITEKDIIEKLKKEAKVEIEKKNIKIEKHIKELGDHQVEIKVSKDVTVKIKVVVKEAK